MASVVLSPPVDIARVPQDATPSDLASLRMVRPLQSSTRMRTSALSIPTLAAVLALGVLHGAVHAEPRTGGRTALHASTGALTGAIAITGTTRTGVAGVAAGELTSARDSVAPRPPRKQAHLSASDVAALVAPHGPAIERCYLDAVGGVRRTSQLDLMFVIARQGHVLSVDIGAPAASPLAVDAMVRCIRSAVDSLHFPERRNDTTAIVPYVFQRTEAPSAGPQLSCWNPKGC
jgi:hypothetical protein